MITQRTAASNIRKVLVQATSAERIDGKDWYQAALERAQLIAADYNVPVELVAHVIAALSPGVRWESNVSAARKMFEVAGDGYNFANLILPGYARNVLKAKQIVYLYLWGDEWRGILKGPKVTEFAANILNPERVQQVTLDTHAISVAMGQRFTAKAAPTLRVEEFNRISKAYLKVAQEQEITPNQCQAISWLVWRRLHKGRGM